MNATAFLPRIGSRKWWALLLIASGSTVFAQPLSQSGEVSIQMPKPAPVIGRFLTPFHLEKRIVPPPRLTNSGRLETLLRGGNLYLSVQDVIALVLENNLDIAVQRYGPPLAQEVLRRAQGGGYLRSVDTPVVAGPTSVSTAGVSTTANGLAGGAGIGSVGSIVSQIGPALPNNLDPFLYTAFQIGHYTTPLTNTLLNATTTLVTTQRQFVVEYGKSFITGTNMYATLSDSHNFQTSSTPLFNPWDQGNFDFYLTQNLLQGFKISVNNRDIRAAKNGIKAADLQLKLQVATTVSAVLNLYWDLVSFNEAVRIKQQGLQASQKFYEDNQKQVAAGALPSIEVTRAAADVSASKEALVIAQTNVQQQEIVLKNALSRNGIASASLEDVHIVPLDHIVVPKTDEVRPIQDLTQEALSNRMEIQRTKINIDTQQIFLQGDKNGLMPSLQAFVDFNNNGLAGPTNPLYQGCCGEPNAYFIGGFGNALGQIFRRNFPNYSAGFSLNIPFRNRQAQADFVTDTLQLRQAELQLQRAINQVRVDVKTGLVGLQQARTRYETAVATRVLAEQSLDAEKKRFQYGMSSVAQVIQAQRDLASDEDLEVQAMANYTHANLAFEFALGRTLDVNHISFEEAASGHVKRESVIPPEVLR